MLRALIIGIALTFAVPAHAQFFQSSIERLTIVSNPAFPDANARVFLALQSVSLDLDRATIEWQVNNRVVAQGEGIKETTITLGGLGTSAAISVTATDENGASYSATRTITPTSIDLLWETDSYVPPFYAGRRLPSSNSTIRVEAVPNFRRANGTLAATNDMIYTWRRNGSVVASMSGRGKSFAQFPASPFATEEVISVEVETADKSMSGFSEVRIPKIEPFVVLYFDHPLFGTLFHRALGPSLEIPDIEATFRAIPFFTQAVRANDPNFTYSWRVNGISIVPDNNEPHLLTINAENSDGNARVELTLTHALDYLLSTSGAWNLIFNSGFGSAPSANLFSQPN